MNRIEAFKETGVETTSRSGSQLHVVLNFPIHDRRVQLLVDFMVANTHLNISLRELADAINLSVSHLSYLFNAEMGLPPGEYLKRLRMEKARHLLSTTFLRVKEIMVMVGYDSKSHFSQDFKRSFGMAPMEYRRDLSSFVRAEEGITARNRKIG